MFGQSLNIGSPVWSPHNKQLITKIERVQGFYTRAIPGLRTLPYRSRLQNLELKTPTPHPRFMPLSQNITRIHSLHHPQIFRFHVISHTWSHPPSTSRKMFHHSQAPFPHQSHRETLELSASRYYQLHNP